MRIRRRRRVQSESVLKEADRIELESSERIWTDDVLSSSSSLGFEVLVLLVMRFLDFLSGGSGSGEVGEKEVCCVGWEVEILSYAEVYCFGVSKGSGGFVELHRTELSLASSRRGRIEVEVGLESRDEVLVRLLLLRDVLPVLLLGGVVLRMRRGGSAGRGILESEGEVRRRRLGRVRRVAGCGEESVQLGLHLRVEKEHLQSLRLLTLVVMLLLVLLLLLLMLELLLLETVTLLLLLFSFLLKSLLLLHEGVLMEMGSGDKFLVGPELIVRTRGSGVESEVVEIGVVLELEELLVRVVDGRGGRGGLLVLLEGRRVEGRLAKVILSERDEVR